MKDENKATSEAITEEQLGEVSGGFFNVVPPTPPPIPSAPSMPSNPSVPSIDWPCNFMSLSAYDASLAGVTPKTVGEGAGAVTWTKCREIGCAVCGCKGVACIDGWHKQHGCNKY
ncbi:MAG: hypothetical protein FWG87_10540 [Defluviitaleaceae bacterium]|nr:hypothetical protein [Defluviitaleaceae bacterium]